MKKTFFMVYVEGENTPVVKHDTQEKADQEAQRMANKYGKNAHVLESIITNEPDEINVKVLSLETACEYLGRANTACMCGVSDKHAKAMAALYSLITIAEAWNKADGFVPDYDNRNQEKWYPWFKKTPAGFVYAATNHTASNTYANIGSRLCFKDSNRARQFGEQFIELWNDFLLFR
jgi:hypothetical protein